jgi:hypothetical protein
LDAARVIGVDHTRIPLIMKRSAYVHINEEKLEGARKPYV